MKKVLFVSLFMTMISVGVYAQEKGSKSLGASVVFGSGTVFNNNDNISNIGYQAKFRYSLTNTWRVEGSFAYFPKKSVDVENINVNVNVSLIDFSANLHYCFPVSTQFTIYPLAGLDYMSWSGWYPEMEPKKIGEKGASVDMMVPTGKKIDFSKSGFGLNIGAGVDFLITENIVANAEFRYRPGDVPLRRTYLSLGVCYKF